MQEVFKLNEKEILTALEQMEKNSKKRKFEQTIELTINFKDMDPKKADNQIDVKVNFPHSTGRGSGKALLFAKTKEFADKVKELFATIIMEDKISELKKTDIAKILEHDVLLAEGSAMLTVGKHLGQDLAPKGKMPKPITPQQADEIKNIVSSAKSSVRITNKKGKGIPLVQVVVGKESFKEKDLAENILTAVKAVENVLPKKKQNIKSIFVKKTMGQAIRVSI